MKYLFDMGEVWHVYADVGNQWIYYRMEQVSEEMLDKKSDTLPGPLGRLEMLQQLEKECRRLEAEREEMSRTLHVERTESNRAREIEREEMNRTLEEEREKMRQEVQDARMQYEELLSSVRKSQSEKQEMQDLHARALEAQRRQFEQSYTELQKMAEEFQREGKQWRQRYLDLAYQVAPKG